MFDLSNYSTKSKYYNDSNALVVGKMKDETDNIVIEKFVGSKPKMYLILVINFSNYEKAKGVGLCYFTIHDPMMHNSCINYPNMLTLYIETIHDIKGRKNIRMICKDLVSSEWKIFKKID